MFSFCYFYIFAVYNIFTFFVSLYKGVFGFLPVPNCKTLTFLKVCQCFHNFSSLEHSHIKEQQTVLYRIYGDVF